VKSESLTVARASGLALALGVGAVGAAFSLQKIRTFDYWWHLRAGQWIAENGAVPQFDPFTFSVPGARWIDIHWLHQLALYGLHSLAGHPAVVFGKAFLVLLMLLFLARAVARTDRPGSTALALLLAVLTLSDRIMPRPELPTFVLLAAELALLQRFRHRPDAWIYALIPLHLVWVNLHGLFAVGIGLLFLALAAEWLEGWLPGRPKPDLSRIRRLLVVALLSLLACLLNPNGLEGLLYPVQQLFMIGPVELRSQVGLSSVELGSLIGHWRSVDPTALFGFLALAAGSGVAMLLNLRRLPVFDALVWGCFFLLALLAMRNVALFGVAAAPLLARHLGTFMDRHPPRRSVSMTSRALLASALLLLAGLVGSGWWALATASARAPGLGVMGTLYPIGAADWIARESPRGPIYHHMGDGGHLIWRLHPDYPVLIDGRLEVFGSQLRELTGTSPEAFQHLDERFHFGIALLGYNHFDLGRLLPWLIEQEEWRLTYLDEVSALFVRRTPAMAHLREVDIEADDLFPPIEGPRSVEQLMRLQGRARFYHAAGRSFDARRIVQDLTHRYPAFVRAGGAR